LQAFAQFGSDLDKATQGRLNRGARTAEILKQGVNQPMSVEKQVISLYAVTKGFLDDIEVADVLRFEKEFLQYAESNTPEIFKSITETKDLTKENEEAIQASLNAFKKGFAGSK
jgi:F-type H+-transporting ATPase subunit alpha